MLDREETGRNRENRLHCLQLKCTCNAGVRSAVRRFNFISRRDGRAMIDNAAHIFCCNFFSAASPLAEEINWRATRSHRSSMLQISWTWLSMLATVSVVYFKTGKPLGEFLLLSLTNTFAKPCLIFWRSLEDGVVISLFRIAIVVTKAIHPTNSCR